MLSSIPEKSIACNFLINKILGTYYEIKTKSGFCEDASSCGFGDPVEIKIKNFSKHPITSYISELQFFACTVLDIQNSAWQQIAFTSKTDRYYPAQPVIIAGEIGKGKIVAVTDNSWAQPFRIEHSDNAQFLLNIINWFGNKPAEKYNKQLIVDSMFITEKILNEIESEEK